MNNARTFSVTVNGSKVATIVAADARDVTIRHLVTRGKLELISTDRGPHDVVGAYCYYESFDMDTCGTVDVIIVSEIV